MWVDTKILDIWLFDHDPENNSDPSINIHANPVDAGPMEFDPAPGMSVLTNANFLHALYINFLELLKGNCRLVNKHIQIPNRRIADIPHQQHEPEFGMGFDSDSVSTTQPNS